VALGVTAVAIAAGYIFDHELVLNFNALEIAFLIAATMLAGLVASNGNANWIEGVQLLAIYAMACIVFWYL
jgi:Ca2+:H+ antiporter